MYPFDLLSDVSGNVVKNSYNLRGGCGGSGPLKAVTGTIVGIRQSSFDL